MGLLLSRLASTACTYLDLDSVSQDVAESLVDALDEAGMIVITNERDRRRLGPAQQAVVDRLRGSASN